MNTNIFTLSPFCSPRSKLSFPKFAILLNEPSEKENSLSTRTSSLAEELLPTHSVENDEDIVGSIAELLQNQIKAHAGVDSSLFTAAEVMKKHSPGLVPLMYRIATEDFAKSCRNQFKIIECRNSTKLVSDWKPSLPDTLIALKHQVIVVQLQESFLPYSDFVYAILRQIDHEWKLRLPRSFFYPNDVCKVEATQDRNLIIVTPSMPDGDLEVSRKMSTLNYELIMMFKRSCIGAMKNHLLMRDMRVGKFQDTIEAVESIRSIYKKLQDRLRDGDEIRIGSGTSEELQNFLKHTASEPLTPEELLEYGKKLGIDCDPKTSCEIVDSPKPDQVQPNKAEKIKMTEKVLCPSARGSARELLPNVPNMDYSILDEKLSAEFDRIESLISRDPVKLDPEGGNKLAIESIQNGALKEQKII